VASIARDVAMKLPDAPETDRERLCELRKVVNVSPGVSQPHRLATRLV